MSARRFSAFAAWLCAMLLPVASMAQEAAHDGAEVAEHKSGGLPQLDPTYYASQLFWLLVSGLLMYVLLARVVIPRVSRITQGRTDKVRHDLEQAARIRSDVEDVKVIYTRQLRQADDEARAMLDKVTTDIKQRQQHELAELAERIKHQLLATEERLSHEQTALLREMPAMAAKLAASIEKIMVKKQERAA